MIRTAQMLLHEALRRHTGSKQIEAFNDTEEAIFGIHRISQVGITLGKKPGEWYGPQTVLHSLKGVSKMEPIKKFRIAVCSDGNIFLDKIFKKISNGNSVFVGIPMRLGITKVMKEYLESIKLVFDIGQNVGIAGGQDHKSLYFTGIVNSHVNNDPHLLYLDPHFVQESSAKMTDAHLKTFQCAEVRALRLSKIATSVLVGFYLRNEADFEEWKYRVKALAKMENGVFSVYDKSPNYDDVPGNDDFFD